MDRTEPLDIFNELVFGVRIDQPGAIERDFQTARTLDGSSSMPLSERYFLADAVFLAGLQSDDDDLLSGLLAAVERPRYPLFLGRRAFPPAGPVKAWIVDADIRTALHEAAWQASTKTQNSSVEVPALEILVDARPGELVDQTLADIPRSFDPRRRRHELRDVTRLRVDPSPRHDPMLLVSEEEV
ncbi:CRISPR system Cascade subunit CasD [Microbacterium trichothecenolyticum]|uniref:CRISPR system Cascade subunit CasD n=2 Tax=Microbacterium trichothecenolyticum TaxID=69370 RepID=A0ABU0TY16_MICTR|nr:CRISPR system Cascade subunit CasD [Microbacterium trichothecenolyticum]